VKSREPGSIGKEWRVAIDSKASKKMREQVPASFALAGRNFSSLIALSSQVIGVGRKNRLPTSQLAAAKARRA
jgi:hypothetical protein